MTSPSRRRSTGWPQTGHLWKWSGSGRSGAATEARLATSPACKRLASPPRSEPDEPPPVPIRSGAKRIRFSVTAGTLRFSRALSLHACPANPRFVRDRESGLQSPFARTQRLVQRAEALHLFRRPGRDLSVAVRSWIGRPVRQLCGKRTVRLPRRSAAPPVSRLEYYGSLGIPWMRGIAAATGCFAVRALSTDVEHRITA